MQRFFNNKCRRGGGKITDLKLFRKSPGRANQKRTGDVMEKNNEKRIIHPAKTLTYLEGIETLHNTKGLLYFDVSIKTGATCTGEILWLQNQLPQWAAIVEDHSHVTILNASVKDPSKDKDRKKAIIVIRASLPGGIFGWKLHNKTGNALSNQLKKIAGEDMLEKIPPNFDFKDPLFLAHQEDRYILHGATAAKFSAHELAKLQSNETIEALSLIAENYNGTFVRIESKPYGNSTVITFLWKRNTSKIVRDSFAKEVKSRLQSERIASDIFPMTLPNDYE